MLTPAELRATTYIHWSLGYADCWLTTHGIEMLGGGACWWLEVAELGSTSQVCWHLSAYLVQMAQALRWSSPEHSSTRS